MKTMKRILSTMLAVVMLICCFAMTLANAAEVEEVISTDGTYSTSAKGKQKVTEESVENSDTVYKDVATDRIAEVTERVTDYAADRDSSLNNSNLIFYDTNPLLYIPTIVEYATKEGNSEKAEYKDTLKDLTFVVPANFASAFTKAFARNLANSFAHYIKEGKEASYTASQTVSELPVIGTVYKGTTDLGNVAIYATTVTINNVSNTALLFLVGGVVAVATVVLIPITWIALPLMFLQSNKYVTASIQMMMDKLNEAV